MDTKLSTKGAQLLLLKKSGCKSQYILWNNTFHSKYSNVFWSSNDIQQSLKPHYSLSLGIQVQLNQRRRKSHFSPEEKRKKEEKGEESWASFPLWRKCKSEQEAAMGSWAAWSAGRHQLQPGKEQSSPGATAAWLGSAGIFHSLPSPALNLAC